MKKQTLYTILAICLTILTICNTHAQTKPEAFIGMIPALPNGACDMSSTEKGKYLNMVSDLSDRIKEEISKRKEEMEQFVSGNKEQMQNNMAADMGLSAADMAKMKSGGNISQAEAMALAEKVMKNKYNMSMGEAKNLSKMSPDGKKAWGEAYGAEMMADAQANPEKYKGDQNKNKQMFEWVQEKKSLAEKHMAMISKFTTQFKELESDSSENKTLRNIEKWSGEWSKMVGVDYGQGSKMDALALQIKSAKISYCNKLSTRYFEIYRQYLTYIKENLPDFYRMEELELLIMEAQTRVRKSTAVPGLIALQSISEYVHKLEEVFKYSLYSSDNPF